MRQTATARVCKRQRLSCGRKPPEGMRQTGTARVCKHQLLSCGRKRTRPRRPNHSIAAWANFLVWPCEGLALTFFEGSEQLGQVWAANQAAGWIWGRARNASLGEMRNFPCKQFIFFVWNKMLLSFGNQKTALIPEIQNQNRYRGWPIF